jgi:adenosylcobinamide amidohydrolase
MSVYPDYVLAAPVGLVRRSLTRRRPTVRAFPTDGATAENPCNIRGAGTELGRRVGRAIANALCELARQHRERRR